MEGWEDQIIKDFGIIQTLTTLVRNYKAENKVNPGQTLSASIITSESYGLLESQKGMLSALAGLDLNKLELLHQKPEKLAAQSPLVSNEIEVYIEGSPQAEEGLDLEKLQKELAEIESQITRLTGLLSGPFGQKAPEAVVAAEREKLENFQKSAEKIRQTLA